MSAYKRVVLTQDDDMVTETVSNDTSSVVEKQANSFDNYTDQKLNDLYKEFDSITVNETDLSTQTIAKI